MKIEGSARVAAPRSQVWSALHDPDLLVRAIPGCQQLEEVAPDTYRLTVRAGIAAIKGTYQGEVALTDAEPPSEFTLRARGQGAPGTVRAVVGLRLSDDGERQTTISYSADAAIGGMAAGVGQRMLVGAARRTADEFFSAVAGALGEPIGDRAATGPTPRRAAAADSPNGGTARAAVYEALPTKDSRSPQARALLRGAFAGAAIALAGVAVGAAVARRGRKPRERRHRWTTPSSRRPFR